MTNIYTVQISVANQLGLTQNDSYLDITVRSGNKAFAPTWDIVMAHKAGRITDKQYILQYYQMMRHSYRASRKDWDTVLAMDEVILACYCHASKFCHRHVLAQMFVRCGATLKGERQA